MDLTAAIKHIQDTSTAAEREAFVTLSDGRTFLYDDSALKYSEIERFVKQEGAVSTVESLAELVVEYADRMKRKTGKGMTVTFTASGAAFSPDDADRRHLFKYQRVLSQQWQALTAAIGKPMWHKDLIRLLQSLSPSIASYPLVMASFRRLVVSKDVRLTSEPTLNDRGDSNNGYNVQLSMKGGTSETTLPSALTLKLQYARASSAYYEIPVEVDLTEKEGVPVITLFAPLLAAIADQAVLDEMKLFEETMDVSGVTELLAVVNF